MSVLHPPRFLRSTATAATYGNPFPEWGRGFWSMSHDLKDDHLGLLCGYVLRVQFFLCNKAAELVSFSLPGDRESYVQKRLHCLEMLFTADIGYVPHFGEPR
jgi:hypothetical protein